MSWDRRSVQTSSLPPHIKRGLNTRKRSVSVQVHQPGETVSTFGSWWDGGSRTTFGGMDLSTGRGFGINFNPDPPQFGGQVRELPLEGGKAIITGGTFCGKPATPCIHLLEGDLPHLGM